MADNFYTNINVIEPTKPGWWLRWNVWSQNYDVVYLEDSPYGLRLAGGGPAVQIADNYLWTGPITYPGGEMMTELINCHWCGKQHDKWITCGSILIDTQELLDLRKRVRELERREKELIESNFLYIESFRYLELRIRELEARCEDEKQSNHLREALEAIRTRAADEVNYDCEEFAEAIFDMANGVLEECK